MGSVFRPKIITYQLPGKAYRTPDGKRVTKDTPGAVRSVTVAKKWYGRYTDGAGAPRQVPLSTNKEHAKTLLVELEHQAQLARFGIVDPFAEHRGQPLLEHLEDFRRYLAAKGGTRAHVAKTIARITEALKGCGFDVPSDLQPAPLVEFLAALKARSRPRVTLPPGRESYTRKELVAIIGVHPGSVARLLRRDELQGSGSGKARRYPKAVVEALQERLCAGPGVSTCNHYLTAVKGFTRWLVRNGRIPADPLAHLERQNPEIDIRRRRRALPEDAFARFIEATGQGGAFRGLSGPDRLVLYTLGAHTGFRAQELASLTPASFNLAAATPTVTVEAGYSKRRRKDVQPIRPDVAEVMRQYIAGKPRGEPIWPGTWKDTGAEMVRSDLRAADIPYEDAEGRCFDFHAMRGQFISVLAANGVHPKVAQVLARHSSITLTMDFYTHLDVLDVTGALGKLPALTAGQAAGEAPSILPGPTGSEDGQDDGKPAATRKARARRLRANA